METAITGTGFPPLSPKERAQLRDIEYEYWRRGELSYLLRPHRQRQCYDHFRAWTAQHPDQFGPIVVNSHRRLGKSFLLAMTLWERCLRVPNTIARFIAPSFKQGRLYLKDINRILRSHCPAELRPRSSGDQLIFKNPLFWEDREAMSIFELVGVLDGGDRVRGPRANIVAVDECREIADLGYLIDDILSLQFADQEEPLLILSSTVPESMAHDYVSRFIPAAKTRGTYLLYPCDDTEEAPGNPDFSPRDRKMVLEELGSEDSIAWQREMLCKLISDPTALLIPSFARKKRLLVREHPRPPHFVLYVGLDFGVEDMNAVLFGYLDFRRQLLVIEDEILCHYASTGVLAKTIKEHQERLYKVPQGAIAGFVDPWTKERWFYKEVRRVADHSMQQILDLVVDHNLPMLPADKWDLHSAIWNLNHSFEQDRIIIHPRCQQLIFQLEHGVWDKRRKTFERSGKLGHCDLVAALNYLHRSVNWREDPYPLERIKPPDSFQPFEGTEKGPIRFEPLNLDFRPL